MTELSRDKITASTLAYRFFLFIIFIFISINQLAYSAMRLPSANRECASCHIMWLTEFKREDVATLIPYEPKPVMETGKQDVASTDPICFSCHDGFVLDSRFLWKQGNHAHPVGVKPSEKITIPLIEGKNLFPMNDDGKVYCGTCHTAHGVDWGQQETAVFMRVRNDSGQLCMSCHESKTKGSSHGTHPVKVKIQDLLKSPPTKLMNAGARFSNEGDVLCQSCHRPHAAPEKNILLMKNDKSQLCGQCHNDRYALNRKQAGTMGTHPVNVTSEEVKISDDIQKQGGKFGKGGEVICETCHKPHSAINETALLVKKNEKDSLCQSCHIEQKKVIDSKHDMTLLRPESKNIKHQLADKQGPCSSCHLPHKGTGPKMWARPLSTQNEAMASLCLSCHKSEGIAEKHQVGEYSHPVGVDMSRLGQPVGLPAFSSEGVKTVNQMKGMVTCASCHDVHQWNISDKKDKGDIQQPGNNRTRFLRIANGSNAELCKACHEEKWNIAGTKHDMRYMAPKSKNVLGQTIAESGICGSCHLVHNANGSRLWARGDLYGQGTGYVACVGCHHENGLAKNKTIGEYTHPMDVEITNVGIQVQSGGWESKFVKQEESQKNSEKKIKPLPLYDENGNLTINNGRVGCGSCHDPHNWTVQDFTYTGHPKKLEGDVNSSFLRVADQGKSGLCVNCHQDKISVFNTKHDLSRGTAFTVNTKKNKPEHGVKNKKDVSTCMHCHMPHNANQNMLWAREVGKSQSSIGKLCADCHKSNGLAKDRLTGQHSHPVGKLLNDNQLFKKLPVFDIEGNRTDGTGLVDCASCHDPHQWDPENISNKGTETKTVAKEGASDNSFLRITANKSSRLCVNCHKDKRLIVGTDHDLGVTAVNEKNSLGQKRDDSGICGQCHIPHNAEDELYLWAKKSGGGSGPIEQRCRSCHDAKKIASNKNPLMTKHPDYVNLWSTEIRKEIKQGTIPDIKVYDKLGRSSKFGIITCASCHNPHQWSAALDQQGSGKNEEGNATNSFLRVKKTERMVCVDCHGLDALYRYKYFHGESSHEKHHMFR